MHNYSVVIKYHLLCFSALYHLYRDPPPRNPPQHFQVPAKQLHSTLSRAVEYENTSHKQNG